MRPESCWTSYPYQAALSWGLTALVVGLVVLAAECSAMPAHAETGPYLNLAAGWSLGQHTAPDGIWYQQGLNYSTDMQSIAWKAGAGLRITERWAIEANYVNFGTRRVHSTFVDDAVYSIKERRCIGTPAQCAATGNLTASDAMQGIEATIAYRFGTGLMRPYVKAGAAYMLNRFTIENYNNTFAQKLRGSMPMAVAGVGLEYRWMYIEADYYMLVGKEPDSTPISTQVMLTTFGFKIPLGGA